MKIVIEHDEDDSFVATIEGITTIYGVGDTEQSAVDELVDMLIDADNDYAIDSSNGVKYGKDEERQMMAIERIVAYAVHSYINWNLMQQRYVAENERELEMWADEFTEESSKESRRTRKSLN